MFICILLNQDQALLDDDPGREAREDVVRVAAAVELALQGGGREVRVVGVDPELSSLHALLRERRPDVVVNLCESLAADSRGEMVVPALLELLEIPYTGSPALALGLALHKDKGKAVLRARGVPTPDSCVVERMEDLVEVDLGFPLIVKPSREDASVGIDLDSVVTNRQALGRVVARVLRTFRQPALVERYVEGREIYVPLLGNSPRRALPLTEIRFGATFTGPKVLSYRAKWDAQSAECRDSPSVPAQLDRPTRRRCVEVAVAAFQALDCRDYGRVDLRVDAEGECYVIDVNPNCDLHPQAGFARAAAAAGIDYADLALHLVELAFERRRGSAPSLGERPTAPPARSGVPARRDLFAARKSLRPRAHRRGALLK